MLVLTRGKGEQVIIGENITITIVRISGDKVRIGIDAPKEVNIVRTDLLDDGEPK